MNSAQIVVVNKETVNVKKYYKLFEVLKLIPIFATLFRKYYEQTIKTLVIVVTLDASKTVIVLTL